MFVSGIGTEHHVAPVLMCSCDRSVRRVDRILHSVAFEILPRPRKTLEATVDGRHMRPTAGNNS